MVGYKSSLSPLKTELKEIGTCAIAEAGFFQGRTTRWGIAWTFNPKIKLSDFMPQKMLRKEKLKPPMSFSIPNSYDSTTAMNKLTELLANHKVIIIVMFIRIMKQCLIFFFLFFLVFDLDIKF